MQPVPAPARVSLCLRHPSASRPFRCHLDAKLKVPRNYPGRCNVRLSAAANVLRLASSEAGGSGRLFSARCLHSGAAWAADVRAGPADVGNRRGDRDSEEGKHEDHHSFLRSMAPRSLAIVHLGGADCESEKLEIRLDGPHAPHCRTTRSVRSACRRHAPFGSGARFLVGSTHLVQAEQFRIRCGRGVRSDDSL